MSIYQNLAGLCNNLLEAMENYQGDNYAMGLGRKLGALDYILSPINVGSAQTSISGLSDGGVKLRKAIKIGIYCSSILRI